MDNGPCARSLLVLLVMLLMACTALEDDPIGSTHQALNSDLGNQRTIVVPINNGSLLPTRIKNGPFVVMVAIDQAGGQDGRGLQVDGACVGWSTLSSGMACSGSGSADCLVTQIPNTSGVQVRIVVQSVAARDTPLFVLAQGEARCARPMQGPPVVECTPDRQVSRWVSKPLTLTVGDLAPDFTLAGHDGVKYTLSQLRGQPVVLAVGDHDQEPIESPRRHDLIIAAQKLFRRRISGPGAPRQGKSECEHALFFKVCFVNPRKTLHHHRTDAKVARTHGCVLAA